MLKDWVSAPLTSAREIGRRQDVVQYLLRPGCPSWDALRGSLFKLPDLEVALMATLYKKIKPQDFVRLCQGLRKLQLVATDCLLQANLPALLTELLGKVAHGFKDASALLGDINLRAAKAGLMDEIFVSWEFSPEVMERKREVSEVLQDLDSHRPHVAKALGVLDFKYSSVSGQDYLIEVRRSHKGRVPDDWLQISSTKQVTRYRDAFVRGALPRLQYARERLGAECRDEDGLGTAGVERNTSLRRMFVKLMYVQAVYDGYPKPKCWQITF